MNELKAIDPIAATIFDLTFFHKMNEVQIATTLETSTKHVRAKALRARTWLTAHLKTQMSVGSAEMDTAMSTIIARATQILGNREEAMRWLGIPVRGLDYATPISLLTTDDGFKRVNDILGRIEHGVW